MSFEKVFDASYERVIHRKLDGRDFFDTFYVNFLGSSDKVREKFAHTDMSRQKRMLKKSFYHLLVFYASNNVDDYLVKIAESHNSKHLNINPDLYDLWLDQLVLTVAEFDQSFSSQVELAWRLVLSTGITYMKFAYSHHDSMRPEKLAPSMPVA